jgi:hypothetical protein
MVSHAIIIIFIIFRGFPMNAAKLPDTAYLVTKAPVSLYTGLSLGALTLTGTWPVNGSKLSITASAVAGHADCAGTLVINGTETITFIQAGKKTSTVSLTARPAVVTTNMDCWLVITVLDSGLAPIVAETLTTVDIKFSDEEEYFSQAVGGFVKRPAQAITEDASTEVGDVMRYDGFDYIIKAIHVKDDRLGLERFRILQF